MVSLWDFMTLICFVLPVGGAIGVAKSMKARAGVQVLAVIAGLVIGFCFAWAMRRFGSQAVDRIRNLPGTSQERYLRLLYLAASLWIVLGFLLSGIASATLIRHVL